MEFFTSKQKTLRPRFSTRHRERTFGSTTLPGIFERALLSSRKAILLLRGRLTARRLLSHPTGGGASTFFGRRFPGSKRRNCWSTILGWTCLVVGHRRGVRCYSCPSTRTQGTISGSCRSGPPMAERNRRPSPTFAPSSTSGTAGSHRMGVGWLICQTSRDGSKSTSRRSRKRREKFRSRPEVESIRSGEPTARRSSTELRTDRSWLPRSKPPTPDSASAPSVACFKSVCWPRVNTGENMTSPLTAKSSSCSRLVKAKRSR